MNTNDCPSYEELKLIAKAIYHDDVLADHILGCRGCRFLLESEEPKGEFLEHLARRAGLLWVDEL